MRAFFRFRLSLRILLLAPVFVVGFCWIYLRFHRVVDREICSKCGKVRVTISCSGRFGAWISPAQSQQCTELSDFLVRLGIGQCSYHHFAFYDRVPTCSEGETLLEPGSSDPDLTTGLFGINVMGPTLPVLEQTDSRMIAHLNRISHGRELELRQFIQRILFEWNERPAIYIQTNESDESIDQLRWRRAYADSRNENPAGNSDR